MIEISVPDGTAEAILARPDDSAGHPGVLLYMDAIGLRPRIQEMADRIASWGYVVLAPNLFYRDGSVEDLAPKGDLRQPGERESFFAGIGPRIGSMTPERVRADNESYVRTLRALDGVADGPVGAVGYCMGARLAVQVAGAHPGVIAAVGGFHGGGLVTEEPASPHLSLATARAEFVFGHADNDSSMGPDAIERLGQALKDAGLTAVNEVYAGAPHGYTMSDTSMYDEAGCERHFTALRALFTRAL
ncbi:dienelactone hydrolase family protein [Nonomuraea sp. B12E4]|uniref:dienelactone hydrolase family protein n=1 Tax=Nonomuraea sp. B12E4 TaxID=3153564 RepID=UPI00325CFA7F